MCPVAQRGGTNTYRDTEPAPAMGAPLRHSRAPIRESTPPRGETSRSHLASSTTGGGLRRGERSTYRDTEPALAIGRAAFVILVRRHGNPRPSRRDLPLPSGLLHHGGRNEEGGTNTCRDTEPAPPSGAQPSSFSCADTGIHAPSRRDLAPRRDPPPRHPPISSMPLSPYHACPEPLEGSPQNPGVVRAGPSARFTSKCRKMSQNVALFHPSTRKPLQFTSGGSHALVQFPAILAHFRSFPRPDLPPQSGFPLPFGLLPHGGRIEEGERRALGPRHS